MRNHPPLDPQDARLTADERFVMRAEMRAFMDARPIRERGSFFLAPRFLRVAMPVAVLVVACGGSALAAERSLPNDLFYPLKVDVIEPAVSSLAFTPSQEAQWSGALVERRLEEAEQLIAQDEMDAEAAAELQERTAQHADAAREAIGEMNGNGDVQAALALGSELEATIDGHLEAIGNLADENPSSEADDLAEAIARSGDDVEDLNATSEQLLEDEPVAENADYAGEARQAADEAIATLREQLATPSEDESVGERSRELLDASLSSYADGEAHAAANDQDAAAISFQDAVQAATQGAILIESGRVAE